MQHALSVENRVSRVSLCVSLFRDGIAKDGKLRRYQGVASFVQPARGITGCARLGRSVIPRPRYGKVTVEEEERRGELSYSKQISFVWSSQ